MKFMTLLGTLIVLTGLMTAPACRVAQSAEKQTISLGSLLREMTDRDALARWPEPAYTCKEFTSYDRASMSPDKPGWFANYDSAHYLRTEQHEGRTEFVMMDADGPGAIVGFFKASTDPEAVVRVYLDNSPTPVIAENMRWLLGGGTETEQEKQFPEQRVSSTPANESRFLGGFGTVPAPLAGVQSLGCTLYLPIPYARHCKVTYDKPGRCYYRINYRTYAPGTQVETFTLTSLDTNARLIEKVCQTLLHPEASIPVSLFVHPAQTRSLAPGASLAVTLAHGPAAVSTLSVKIDAGDSAQALRSTVLTISFDGVQTVWCPVGDFFSSGIGLHAAHGWDKSVEADGTMRCFWTMPFQKTCKIALVNLGAQPVRATLHAAGGTSWAWSDRSLYFHAGWRQQRQIQTKAGDGTTDWNYLEASGKGIYVGDTLVMHNGSAGWWGEGDEKIYVDGEAFPSHFGTGTEDYYGYSRGGRDSAYFEAPFNAHPQVEGDKQPGYSALTRVRSLDAIPFTDHLKFDMEIWHWQATTIDYAATTYWYARPGAASNRVPSPDEAARPVLTSPPSSGHGS